MNLPTKKSSFYKSAIQRDMSYDNIKSLTFDEPIKSKPDQAPSQRSSIKSLITKKFHSSSSSNHENATINSNTTPMNKTESKQKKRRTSFRQFSQFLKRSHSTNTDLSTIASNNTSIRPDNQQNKIPADLIYQRLQAKKFEENESTFLTRSNTSIMCNGSGTALVPISEEENPIPIKPVNRLTTTNIDDEDYYYDNAVRPDSGALTHQQTQRIAPSLSMESRRISFIWKILFFRFVFIIIIHFCAYVIAIRYFCNIK